MRVLRGKAVVEVEYLKLLSSNPLSSPSRLQPAQTIVPSAPGVLLTRRLPIRGQPGSSTGSWPKAPKKRDKVPLYKLLRLTDLAEKRGLVVFVILPSPGGRAEVEVASRSRAGDRAVQCRSRPQRSGFWVCSPASGLLSLLLCLWVCGE